MEQPKGHPCPECGAPREPDNTPSCTCAERAAEALRETRTAEAAAAEDFDPLRIRPYVALDAGPQDGAGGTAAAGRTMPLPTATPAARPAAAAPATPEAHPAPAAPATPDATAVLPAASTATSSAAPSAASTTPPTGGPARDFAGPGPYETGEQPPRRRRAASVVAVAGALVAVVTAAGYASGLFAYESPSRDTALPDDVRASVPDDASAGAPSTEPAPATPSARPGSAAPARPPASSASPSPSPSPSVTSASPSPTQPSGPASPAPTASGANGSMQAPDDDAERSAPVLRRGDQGPEVTELQLRLRQLYLYNGPADGHFSSQVEDAVRTYQWSRGVSSDELGVYGRETRTKLESETKEP
ncbi:peptidoglycan-binding domain-containing protein [Streptomyces bullii]|uniref:Peptidoglycan-binding protein n=1 Tax=Streptomyces bullii TaxID=349910 RepID=A0ABW0UFF3_9ACTN